ncbi:MAG: hypothetical protein Kow0080_26020 [Candidatus Promineifilaceae bacterium]|jgi:hypothetical protein
MIFLTSFLQSTIGDPNQFNNYLALGYAAMWLIGTIYVISLNARQRNLSQDIQLLKRLLQDDDETAEK